MACAAAGIAPEVDSLDWEERVTNNPLPVMVHLWSEAFTPDRSEALAEIVDDVALEYEGKLDVVRSFSKAQRLRCCANSC